jgi:hypothetical protein
MLAEDAIETIGVKDSALDELQDPIMVLCSAGLLMPEN